MSTVKIIPKELTYSIRQEVLRKGKPIESCYFDGDSNESTFHFGIYINKELAGIATLLETKTDLIENDAQYQLRGMAVLDLYRKKNIGTELLKKIERFCIENEKEILWFNARKTAIEFYKKSGYEILGKEFEIENIGTHFLMFKKLI
ncbi:MAG: GNAT family N-acetyltransferase [Limnohabitans sp.]|nr:GNAT family N-acetyltransferase [Limnohabitans sp.]